MVQHLDIRITVDDKTTESGGVVPAGSTAKATGAGAIAGAAVGGTKKPFKTPTYLKQAILAGGVLSETDIEFLDANPNTLLDPKNPLAHRQSKAYKKFTAKKAPNVAGNVSKAGNILKNPTPAIIGAITAALTNPAVLTALATYGIFSVALDQYFKDGAVGDRRLKLLIEEQVVPSIQRELLRDIRKGKQTIRVSSASGLRGRQGSINSNLSQFRGGNHFNIDLNENDHKGIFTP